MPLKFISYSKARSKQWKTWISMHPEISVTKLKVTCHTVTVTISKFHCVNALMYCCHLDEKILFNEINASLKEEDKI